MSFHLAIHFRVTRLKRQFRRHLGWRGGIVLGLLLTGAFLSLFTSQWEEMMDMPAATNVKEPGQTTSAALATGQILAQDDFQHPDQSFWKQVMNGQILSSDPNGSVSFVSAGDKGLIIHGSGGLTALLGPRVENAEVVCIGALSDYTGANVGMFLRRIDAGNWYKTYLNGTELVLQQSRAGKTTLLAHIPFKVNANQLYVLRFRAIGNQLQARAWAQGSPEPTVWMVTGKATQVRQAGKSVQAALPAGYAGMSLQLQINVTARITRFVEVSRSL